MPRLRLPSWLRLGRPGRSGLTLLLVALTMLAALGAPAGATPRAAEPAGGIGPEQVFRESTFKGKPSGTKLKPLRLCLDSATPTRCVAGQHDTGEVTGLVTAGATRAELSAEFWGGHIGTLDQQLRVNGAGDWLDLQLPKNTPGVPRCYYHTQLGHAVTPIELAALRSGANSIMFRTGLQETNKSICEGTFGWGNYWVYAYTLRVFYDPGAVAHPTGRIVAPAAGTRLGESPTIAVSAQAPQGRTIEQVDLLGDYLDFDWDGNGVLREWQYRTELGELRNHIGTATRGQDGVYRVAWDTAWLPDQDQPFQIMARIVDSAGFAYTTPAVTVSFRHLGRSVRMYMSSHTVGTDPAPLFGVPKNFSVRAGKTRTATLTIPDSLTGATDARLIVPTWSADITPEEPNAKDDVRLNSHRLPTPFGRYHDYSFDVFPIPVGALQTGANTFSIYSNRQQHMLEINWPGPALLVALPPVTAARPQSLTTDEDTPLALTLGGTSADGGPLKFSLLSAPRHGTLSGTAPDLVYRPASNYSGSDGFTFQVEDGAGAKDSATVSISVTPVNDVPIVDVAQASRFVLKGGTFRASGTVVDPDAASLSATVDYGDGAGAKPLALDSGRFSLSRTYAASGRYAVVVTATDDQGAASSASVDVTVSPQLNIYMPLSIR